MKLYANLHTHSTHSDGRFTPREIVKVAKNEGYRAIAVTDHDTATAYAELQEACREEGMECIFGVEFTCPGPEVIAENEACDANEDWSPEPVVDNEYHVVGYHFDPEYPPMRDYLDKMSISETDQTRILFERGQRLGTIPAEITWDEVLEYNKGITWLCNDHLFRALKSKGLITDAEYEEYFRLNFGDHRLEIPPLYDFKTVKEIVELIHAAGGIAIIAHPANQLQYIDRLIEWGIDGIEVWHSDLVRASKRNAEKTGIYVDQQEQALRIALEKNLYISGGSDHSGLCGGLYELSDNPEQEWYYTEPLSTGTTKEYFEEIRDRRKNRK